MQKGNNYISRKNFHYHIGEGKIGNYLQIYLRFAVKTPKSKGKTLMVSELWTIYCKNIF